MRHTFSPTPVGETYAAFVFPKLCGLGATKAHVALACTLASMRCCTRLRLPALLLLGRKLAPISATRLSRHCCYAPSLSLCSSPSFFRLAFGFLTLGLSSTVSSPTVFPNPVSCIVSMFICGCLFSACGRVFLLQGSCNLYSIGRSLGCLALLLPGCRVCSPHIPQLTFSSPGWHQHPVFLGRRSRLCAP